MKVQHKQTEVILTSEEKENIYNTFILLGQICQEFVECVECPLYHICHQEHKFGNISLNDLEMAFRRIKCED